MRFPNVAVSLHQFYLRFPFLSRCLWLSLYVGLGLLVVRAHPWPLDSSLSTQCSKNHLSFPPQVDAPAGLIEQRLQKHLPYAWLAGASVVSSGSSGGG